MRYSATYFDNGRTHKGIIFVAILLVAMNAYAWEQKEFMIGTYSPPIVSPDIILLPGDYDEEKYLSLPMPQFERVPAFENVVEPEEESIIDVYDLYGRQILRGAKLQHLEKLNKGYYIIITKQGEVIYREKYIVK